VEHDDYSTNPPPLIVSPKVSRPRGAPFDNRYPPVESAKLTAES